MKNKVKVCNLNEAIEQHKKNMIEDLTEIINKHDWKSKPTLTIEMCFGPANTKKTKLKTVKPKEEK